MYHSCEMVCISFLWQEQTCNYVELFSPYEQFDQMIDKLNEIFHTTAPCVDGTARERIACSDEKLPIKLHKFYTIHDET